jgi:hypothetical protein
VADVGDVLAGCFEGCPGTVKDDVAGVDVDTADYVGARVVGYGKRRDGCEARSEEKGASGKVGPKAAYSRGRGRNAMADKVVWHTGGGRFHLSSPRPMSK